MSVARRRYQHLKHLRALAPLSVAARAEQELRESGRLHFDDRSKLQSLTVRGSGEPPPPTYGCWFPVAFPQDDPRCEGISGGVVRACCTPAGLPAPPGAEPARLVFAAEQALRAAIEGWEGHGVELLLLPRPGLAGATLLGDSAGAALAVAFEAARRQREVPGDVVISAAVRTTAEGLVLEPVGNTVTKARAAAVERPGCRFLVLPRADEDPTQVEGIRVEILAPGPIAPLLDRLLGAAPRLELTQPRQSLLALLDQASARFRSQRYEEAEPLYREALARLESLRDDRDCPLWRYQIELRLAAVRLHRGQGPDASPAFERLARQRPEDHGDFGDALEVEELSGVAAAHIDRFDPARAREALALLSWVEALSPRRGANRQMMLAYYGTTTQLRLLEGDVQAALDSQQRVVDASPPHERARSLCNLGECWQRAGRRDKAEGTWAHAHEALHHVEDYYRDHTRAFLVYLEGRAALLAGDDDSAAWRARASEALAPLEPTAAAAWRLAGLVDLARLAGGDRTALSALVDRAQAEARPFVRWHLTLELLRAAHIAPALASEAHAAAAALLTALPKPAHSALEQARMAFCEAAVRGAVHPALVEGLLARRAY